MRAWGAINVFAPLTDSGNILRQSNGASHRSLSLLLLLGHTFYLHVHLLFNPLFLVGNVQTKRKEKGDLYTHPGNTISIIPEHDSPWLCLSRACTSAYSLVTNYYNSNVLPFFSLFLGGGSRVFIRQCCRTGWTRDWVGKCAYIIRSVFLQRSCLFGL